MHTKRVVVLGSSGQLGSELQNIQTSHNLTFLDRALLDLEDFEKVKLYFKKYSCDILINCAAYTAVDRAESEIEKANKINHDLVKLLASLAKEHTFSLIQISTDYVFDGKNYTPYKENDPTHPQNIYGRTKCDGENSMIQINPKNSIIIRTSWVYSGFGNNFVKTMLRLAQDRDQLGVVSDQVGTPTYAKDLAKAIMEIVPQLDNQDVQIYHYSNEGACSWYDFAKAIFEIAQLKCQVNALETFEYPTPVARPPYSLLSKAKIKKDFSLQIPYWRESLKSCIQILKDNHL